jgi:hypothetical protein
MMAEKKKSPVSLYGKLCPESDGRGADGEGKDAGE